METKTQVVYTNWDPCNDIEMLGLQRMSFKDWTKNPSGVFLYAIDYRYNFDSAGLNFAKLYDNVHILLDDTLEGFSYRTFKKVYKLVKDYNLENRVTYATGHLDAEKEYTLWLRDQKKIFDVYPLNSWFWRHRDWAVDCGNDVSVDKDMWYCCLQNRPRQHRSATTIYLHYLDLLKHGLVSANIFNLYNVFNPENFNKSVLLKKQIPKVDKILPLCLDVYGDIDKCYPNDLNPDIYGRTLINLVSETFYTENDNNRVSEMFITEKTYKSFTCYQMPVIIGPKGVVKRLREYGFDMFDDIIDHSYDDLDDAERLFGAVDVLRQIIENKNLTKLNAATKKRRIDNKKLYLNGLNIDKKVTDYLCT